MKKVLLTIVAFAAAGAVLFAQEEPKKEMKTGWSFGLLPTATWSTDNGFQLGAFGDVYNYGDGSTYPDPRHKISWEFSHFLKSHRTRAYLAYDSKYLIPGMRINASVTYMDDPLYSFWGFNGPAAVQDYYLWSNRNTAPNINYYGLSRKMLRVLANVQGRVTDHLNWAAGVNFWKWDIGNMRDSGNVIEGETTNYDPNITLYKKYQDLQAIPADEANGGLALEFNAGLVFDTRDMEAAPNKGIWAEAYLNGNVLQHRYLKACVYFRHYIDIPIHIPAGDPVFAYRLAWQQTLLGETPFYMIQNVPLLVQRNMISEGFGSSNTIRGVRENRILAEGFAWANTELRVKLFSFKLFNQYFYLAMNPFFDAGIITKGYRETPLGAVQYDTRLVNDVDYTAYTDYLKGDRKVSYNFFTGEGKYVEKTEKDKQNDLATLESFNAAHGAGYDGKIYDASHVHDVIYSAGIGIKLAMNQNFIISAEYAKCFYSALVADPWIGIGINYQF